MNQLAPATGTSTPADVAAVAEETVKNREKRRHHMLFLAKLHKVKVWHSNGSYVR